MRLRDRLPHVDAEPNDDVSRSRETTNAEVDRIARAFGSNVVLSGDADPGALREVATDDGIPTITVEMGKAHRFQPALIERAVDGVGSVLAEVGVRKGEPVVWPGWRKVVDSAKEKTWVRADTGGLVDMEWGPAPLVHQGETICTISDHFRIEEHDVTAPFTGLIVGVLENPLALPGHPLCHLVRIDEDTRRVVESFVERGDVAAARADGIRWSNGEAS